MQVIENQLYVNFQPVAFKKTKEQLKQDRAAKKQALRNTTNEDEDEDANEGQENDLVPGVHTELLSNDEAHVPNILVSELEQTSATTDLDNDEPEFNEPGVTAAGAQTSSKSEIFTQYMFIMDKIWTLHEKNLSDPIMQKIEKLEIEMTNLQQESVTASGKGGKTKIENARKQITVQLEELRQELLRIPQGLTLDGASEHMQYMFKQGGEFSSHTEEMILKKRKVLKFCNALSLLMQPLDHMANSKDVAGYTGFTGLHKYFSHWQDFLLRPTPPKIPQLENFLESHVFGKNARFQFNPCVKRSMAVFLRHFPLVSEEAFSQRKRMLCYKEVIC